MWGRGLGLWGLTVPFSGVWSGCFGGEIGVQLPHLEFRSGGAPKVRGPGLLPGAPPPRRGAAAAQPAQHSDRSPAGPAPEQAPPPPRPRPAPPRRSPIQLWVRGEQAAPTSQASKMAPGGRL